MKLLPTSKFELLWKIIGGQPLVKELRFHPIRKWRFDYSNEGSMIAIEIEGGVWVNGAHNRGKHFTSDCEKYMAAALMGWTVFRLTADMVTSMNLTLIDGKIKELNKL